MYFLIENDDLLEQKNTISDKVSADIKKEFDSDLFAIINFWNLKYNLMVMKLQIFTIKNS